MTLASITHTARRSHLCSQCGRTIGAGERYVRARRPDTELTSPKPFHEVCYRSLSVESK